MGGELASHACAMLYPMAFHCIRLRTARVILSVSEVIVRPAREILRSRSE